MSRDRDGTYGPWNALKSLLASPEASGRPTRHPRRSVLRAYVAGSLPDRPEKWSLERVDDLATASLTTWSRWEVAAHLAVCERCKKRLPRLMEAASKGPGAWPGRIVEILRGREFRAAGWALAAAQAAAIAAFLLWNGIGSSDHVITKPGALPDLNLASSVAFPQSEASFRVEFHSEVGLAEVSEWLRSRALEIEGPDEMGRYLVFGEDVSADLLIGSGWIRSIHAVEGEPRE